MKFSREVNDLSFYISFNQNEEFVKMTENGVPYKLKINSKESDLWINEGLEKNTLVRLSGLPNQIVPSIGVKDSFGDWLFTWSDLVNNNNIINLFADPYWSGIASFSLFITQLRSDASYKFTHKNFWIRSDSSCK